MVSDLDENGYKKASKLLYDLIYWSAASLVQMLHYIQNNLASEEIESRVSELTEGSGDPEVEKKERKKRKNDINRDVKSAKTATYRVVSVAMHDVLQCYLGLISQH